MRVAITGSAGFIGSNLVEACLRKGWDVIGVDNLSTGFDEMADPVRVIELPGSYAFIKMDINETKRLTEVLDGCVVVFLLAALPRVSFSIDNPIEANNANISGTLSVLEAARQAGVKRVIFSCSSSVYGGVSEFPTPETAQYSPKSPYALHKATGASYCQLYSELHGLDTVSLLYFNVFGPYQRTGSNSAYNTVITAFMECAISEKQCRIDGNGGQSRDFTFVDDIVEANILAAKYKKPLMGDRFNIACGNTYSVLEIYEKINNITGNNLTKYYAPRRAGDPMKSLADISRAKQVLLYNPKVDIDSGLDITWKWWKGGCKIKPRNT